MDSQVPTTLTDITAIESRPLEERDLPSSTYELLARSAARFGDAPALHLLSSGTAHDTPLTLSFRELLALVHRTANLFSTVGLRRGGVVSALLPNLPQTYTTIWGAQAVGVINPINPLLAPEHVAHIVRSAGTEILVAPSPTASPDLWEKAVHVAREVSGVRVLLVVGGAPDERHGVGQAAVLDFDRLVRAQPADRLMTEHRPGPQDFAAYFHTGGTTGTPKLAAHTHRNEVYMAWAIGVVCGLTTEDVLLSGLPLFHVNARHVTGLAPLLYGASVVGLGPLGYRDRSVFERFWKIVARYRATTFSGVPTVFSVLSSVPVDADISSLRFAVVGAAPLAPQVQRTFEARTGVPMCEAYGMTEGTCGSTFTPLDARQPGSVGLRFPYQRVKTVRIGDDGRPVRDCAPGEGGLVMISGPNVFPGYVRQTADGPVVDASDKVIDGWLDTGDLGRIDDDGYLWLTGRAKDLIIRGGHNIDPAIIEDVLYTHPDVAEAAAVGRPDPRAGEVPVAYVALKPGATVTADDLRDYVAERVSEPPAAPKEICLLDGLPMTAIGKVFKPALRRDAVRRVVLAELGRAGLTGMVLVDDEGGVTTAVIRVSAAPADLEALARNLGGYSFAHRFADPPEDDVATTTGRS
jgi:fatty-acyl-CoA synthase